MIDFELLQFVTYSLLFKTLTLTLLPLQRL